MFPTKEKPKYDVEYLVIDDHGKHKVTKRIGFGKPKEEWDLADYGKIEQLLALLHKGRVNVSIIDVREVK